MSADLVLPPYWMALAALIAGAVPWLLARELHRHRWRQLLDVPGQRSSHERPTPRGGGIGIVVVVLAAVAGLGWSGALPVNAWLLLSALAIVGAIGSMDDLRPLPAAVRLCLHLLAAGLLVLAARPLIEVAGTLTPLLALTATLAMAWSVNLHNFMDGIDTLLAGQTIWCAAAFAALLLVAGDPASASLAVVLMAATIGFLPWNWPPAKVFLGDGASGFIGLALAWLAFYGGLRGMIGWPESLVVASAFLIDSGATLVWRALRGQAFWRPHREHLYQYLVRAGAGHGQVSVCYMLWNLLFALPALIMIRLQSDPSTRWAIALAVLAFGLLVWIAFRAMATRRLATAEPG